MENTKKNNNKKKSCKVCKICNRCFASGKAMGGHMRSHFAKLPIPPKHTTNHVAPLPENTVLVVHGGSGSTSNRRALAMRSTSSSSSFTIHPWKDSPIAQNFRSLNRDFAAAGANDDEDEDEEGESESDQSYPTRRRSKRSRKFIAAAAAAVVSSPKTKADEDEPKQAASSIFDALFPAAEAARSLVMLSKDKWPEGQEVFKKKQLEEDDHNDDDNKLRRIRSRGSRFECEMCNKVFGSYQALGGHKASHKKVKNIDEWEEYDGNVNLEDAKGFECLYCSRVFESGQALGGHKKSHLPNAKKVGVNVIDLNLPAAGEDEAVSQIAFSTLSSEDY